MRIVIILLLCASQLQADEKPTANTEDSHPGERAAVTAIEALGGSVRRGSVVLRSPNVTDDDLKHLQALTDLRSLVLSGTKITDAAVVHLKELTRLRLLQIRETSITKDGVKQLESALPNCRVLHGSSPRPQFPSPPRKVPNRFTTSAVTAVNRVQVLALESVREELSLTDDQRGEIDAVLTAWAKREEENAGNLHKAGSLEEGRRIFGASRADGDAAWTQVCEILTDDQEQRFEQLKLQKSGFRLFVQPPRALFAELGISADQRQQFAEIYQDWGERYGLPARGTKSWDTLMERLLVVFTPEQRNQWNSMTGEPFDFRTTKGHHRFRGGVTFPNLGRDSRFVQIDWVQDDLGLTKEQLRQIAGGLERWQRARDDVDQQLRSIATPGGDAERARESVLALTDLAVEITDRMTAVLTDDQQIRLQQLHLQKKGIYAFREPTYRNELQLTTRQMRQLIELSRVSSRVSASDNRQPAPPIEKGRQLMIESLEILTDEQRNSWLAKVGKPAAFPGNPYGSVNMSEHASERNDQVIAEFFDSDFNRDGVITADEALRKVEIGGASQQAAMASKSASSSSSNTSAPAAGGSADEKYLKVGQRIVERYDKNEDGALTASEWEKMLMSPAAADADRDGRITVQEYALWMQSRQKK